MSHARGAFEQGRVIWGRRSLILVACLAAWTVLGEVAFAQHPAAELEPGRLRLVATPAPWPRWPFVSAMLCGRDLFVAARDVYVSRDGSRWQHARRGLPRRYAAATLACIDGTAFVVGYPAMIARWEPDSRLWQVEHAAPVDRVRPVDYWPVLPYVGWMVRERTDDGWRLRCGGLERINEPMDLVRRPDGTWERIAPWTDGDSMLPRHCGTGPGGLQVSPDGAIELCDGLPHRLLLWRSWFSVGGPWPTPEEIRLPPPPPDSGNWGAWWSPTAVLVFGPVLRERPWRDQDRPFTHQLVTLYHRGEWRRAIVEGYETVAGPVELGSSMFLFTSHHVYRVIESRSERRAPRR
jgi:hypothetical protein